MKVGQRVRISEDDITFPGWWGEVITNSLDSSVVIKLRTGETSYFRNDKLEVITPSLDCLLPGDVIYTRHEVEARVLEVGVNTFLRSSTYDFNSTDEWLTFEEAKANGWKLKNQEEETLKLTVSQVSDKYGRTVEIVKE